MLFWLFSNVCIKIDDVRKIIWTFSDAVLYVVEVRPLATKKIPRHLTQDVVKCQFVKFKQRQVFSNGLSFFIVRIKNLVEVTSSFNYFLNNVGEPQFIEPIGHQVP